MTSETMSVLFVGWFNLTTRAPCYFCLRVLFINLVGCTRNYGNTHWFLNDTDQLLAFIFHTWDMSYNYTQERY